MVLLDESDHAAWVHSIANTFFGDANLDGEFNSRDLVTVFEAGEYEDNIAGNSGWAEGDWNGDGDFSTSDLVAAFEDGGYEKGPRALGRPVPEAFWILPSILLLFVESNCLGRDTKSVDNGD